MFVAIFGTGTIFDEVLSPHYKGSILPFLLRGGVAYIQVMLLVVPDPFIVGSVLLTLVLL